MYITYVKLKKICMNINLIFFDQVVQTKIVFWWYLLLYYTIIVKFKDL